MDQLEPKDRGQMGWDKTSRLLYLYKMAEHKCRKCGYEMPEYLRKLVILKDL